MCGISFIQKFREKDKVNINNILNSMRNRGPDDQQYKIVKNNFFAFSYLSITGGYKKTTQPYKTDNSLLIFNGEIYNYLKLAKELNFNHLMKNRCDTELLSLCLEKFGIKKTLNKIEGMWSFIFYDFKKEKIYISRDPLGIKPLFYYYKNKKLTISSSIKTIFKSSLKNFYLNKSTVKTFIKKGNLNQDNNTFFKGIKVFPAANYATYDLNLSKINFFRYWKIKKKENNFIHKNYKKIQTNIESHFNYNKNTALPLSYGLDSNILHKYYKDKKKLNCYTLYNVPKNVEHTYIKKKTNFVNAKEAHSSLFLKKFLKVTDQPVRSFQPLYQYLIRVKAKENKARIVLNGDGADEVYGGYPYAIPYLLAELINKKKISLARIIAKNYQKFTSKNYEELLQIAREILKDKKNKIKNYKDFMINRIIKTHVPYWLHMDDLLSMECSIENRVPFLQYSIIELIMKVKSTNILSDGTNKQILRKMSKLYIKQKHPKYHKPGNYEIIYKTYSKDFERLIKNGSLKLFFDKKTILKNFINDKTSDIKSMSTNDYWTRIYFLFKWVEINDYKFK